VTKVFRRGLDQQPGPALSAATGMPSRNDLDLQSFSASPDGREIAFTSAAGGHTSIWSMNTDGTGVVELAGYDASRFPFSCSSLTWTPG
jgi:Tol biopolymer transport system component